mmetsp:Transcript_106895/g.189985  ORF Transcript_106895/g.189985 Transcript_106895/m.189985 type:complete len:262 (-) Transcript_106895:824-1609(-)
MQVPVHANVVVEVFLLVAFCLHIGYLLLELCQSCPTSLQLLFASKVLCICLGKLNAILLALLLKFEDALLEVLCILLPPSNVFLHVHRLRLLALHEVNLLLCPLICLDHILVEDVALAQEVLNLFAVNVRITLQSFGLFLRSFHLSLQCVALALSCGSFFVHRLLLLLQGLMQLHGLLLLCLMLLELVPSSTQGQLTLLTFLHILLIFGQLLLEFLLQLALFIHLLPDPPLKAFLVLLGLHDSLLNLLQVGFLASNIPASC